MSNYTISEMVNLPSGGKIYGQNVDPHIELRSMTTAEEMKRLSQSGSGTYKTMCNIIDDCMVNNPGISSYDMCLGDYIFLLYKLRIVTYGSTYRITSTCPFCGCNNVSEFSLDDLTVMPFDEETNNKFKEFELPVSKKVVTLNYQTPSMFDSVSEQVKEFRSKTKGKQPDPTLIYTIKSLIDTVDGKKPNPLNIDNWIKNLPMLDTNTILNYADRLNNSIGIDTAIQNECDICGLTYDLNLSITNEFFRPALNI